MEANIKEMTTSVNTLTFRQNLSMMKNILTTSSTEARYKLMIGEFLFRKLHYLYNLPNDEQGKLLPHIEKAIRDIPSVIAKASYLKYHNLKVLKWFCSRFFLLRFTPEEHCFVLQMLNDTELIKLHIHDHETMKKHFVEWIEKTQDFAQRSNLLDVLLKYFKTDPQVHNIAMKMRYGDGKSSSLYGDAQSAHNEVICNESVRQALQLFEDTKHLSFSPDFERPVNTIIYQWYGESPTTQVVITRISIDHTIFGSTDEGKIFTMAELFERVILYIQAHPETERILKERLYEEIQDMSNLCATGYVNRVMNIFRGVVDDYQVNIDFGEQLFAVMSQYISRAMQSDVRDEVVQGSYDTKFKLHYVDFIVGVLNDALPEMISNYGEKDISAHLQEVFERLTDTDSKYEIKRGKIVVS